VALLVSGVVETGDCFAAARRALAWAARLALKAAADGAGERTSLAAGGGLDFLVGTGSASPSSLPSSSSRPRLRTSGSDLISS
jgi:hypothetical protein